MTYSQSDIALKNEKLKNQSEMTKHIRMMFSPFIPLAYTAIIIMSLLIVICVVSTVFHLNRNPFTYDITIALYTGVFASGIVSIALEMSKNYATNYKANIILIEYYWALAQLSDFQSIKPKANNDDEDDKKYSIVLDLFFYQNALKQILSISDIEKTYLSIREILHIKALENNKIANMILNEGSSQDQLSDIDIESYNDFLKSISVLEEEMLKKPYYSSLFSKDNK